jgi:hypothetical protein
MWYGGWGSGGTNGSIGYATSPDGIIWTEYEGNPVLSPGNDSWDDAHIEVPEVHFDGNSYHMWYTGRNTDLWFRWRVGYATSTDGLNWIKYVGNPVLKPSADGWDSQSVGMSSPVSFDSVESTFKMWYMGGSANWVGGIGYATAPLSIRHVPNQYETIQNGIDAADSGDVVLVDEGTYYENINFKGKAITVASQYFFDGDTSHSSGTIIDGSQPSDPDSGSVVYFITAEDTTSVLAGFTITGGTGTISQYTYDGNTYDCRAGGGVFCGNSGPRLIYNKIINNNITTENKGLGSGISIGEFGNDSYVIIENNTIMNNTINATETASGGGIILTCNGRIVGNDIHNNSIISTGTEADGGGIRITTEAQYPRTVTIKHNTISHNLAQGRGTAANGYWASTGGGLTNTTSKVLILNNQIFSNLLKSDGSGNGLGGGIYLLWSSSGSKIDGNNIYNNSNEVSGTKYGGGIRIGTLSGLAVTNNIIYNNHASHGAGISLYNNNTQIINNTIVHNIASSNGGGIHADDANPVIFNTIVWDNDAQINTQISNNEIVRYSNVQGEYTGEGNIDVDPLFVDSLSFELSDSSPCIGAGKDSIQISANTYYCLAEDMIGNPRPYPRESIPDMGAIEHRLGVPASIEDTKSLIVLTFELDQNYPNPFNPATIISYQLPMTNEVELSIFNVLGQKVVTLLSEKQNAGRYQIEWDATDFASGIYYYQLVAGDYREVKKMILLR